MAAISVFQDALPQPSSWFLRDYMQSRASFLAQAEAMHAEQASLRSWCLSQSQSLYCDTLWLGKKDATKVIVLISGTHGVEGFCGSAVQRFLLACLNAGELLLPDDVALLIVHALNPWGMLHARRCDQNGVDLNRNFIDFSNLPAAHPEYAVILQQLIDAPSDKRHALMLALAESYGQVEFDTIFSRGQYHCEWGPFYGGTHAVWSNQLVDSLISDYQLVSRSVVVLDIHSGLGPWGFGELISDHPAASAGEKFARSLFGASVASVAAGNSFSVTKHGLLDYRWHELMQESGCFLTLEFGTYGTANLFEVIFADHQRWRKYNQAELTTLQRQIQQQSMVEHFCPDNVMWQQAVLFRAWQVFTCCIKGFSGD